MRKMCIEKTEIKIKLFSIIIIAICRKELHSLKKESRSSSSQNSEPSILASGGAHNNVNLENKLHNDEATIEWLKDSTKEMRTQMKEISESCNMTVMAQMKEQMDKDAHRRDVDLADAEKQLELLRLKQLRQDEQISEAKGNIQDLRSWQVKMGQKLIENKGTAATTATGNGSSSIHDRIDNDEASQEEEEKSNSLEFGGEEHFITEAFKGTIMLHSLVTRLHRRFLSLSMINNHKRVRFIIFCTNMSGLWTKFIQDLRYIYAFFLHAT